MQARSRNALRTDRWKSEVLELTWRIALGALLPALVIATLDLIGIDLPPSAMGTVVVAAVGVSAYLVGLAGACASLIAGLLVADWLFINDRWQLDAWSQTSTRNDLILTVFASIAVGFVVWRMRSESQAERQSTFATRSAASALAAIETAATASPSLDVAGQASLHQATLRAVIGMNRAHSGALYLRDPEDSSLNLAASYGFSTPNPLPVQIDPDTPLLSDVIDQRRVVTSTRGNAFTFSKRNWLAESKMRSFAAAPINSSEGEIEGVMVIGLLAQHRFRPAEMRRLEALANQVATILQTISATGAREQMLREARDEVSRLETLIAALPEAVVVCAPPDGRVVAANASAMALFGEFTGDELPSRLLTAEGETASPESLPIAAVLQGATEVDDLELIALDDHGSQTPVLASAAPVTDSEGNLTAVVAAFRDIGPLKEASRVREEFISVVSHELRSPLTPIRGYVQLVARDLEREGGHQEDVARLRSISGHVDRLTRLVDDLLDVSGLRSGSLEIKPVETDLVQLCRELVATQQSTHAQATVSFASDAGSLVGNWDGARLHQVIDNLVGNALKYGKPSPTIRVALATSESGDGVRLTVEDDGPGLKPGEEETLFAPWTRTEAAVGSHVPGLGLGLYICRALVEAHGGSIRVIPSELGGAGFEIVLPGPVTTAALEPATDIAPGLATISGPPSDAVGQTTT